MADCTCNTFPASLGNIGIGFSAPSYRLDVLASSTNNDSIRLQTPNADGGLLLRNTSSGGVEWFIDSTGTGSGYLAGKLAFVHGIGGSNILTLTGNGVGIGTTLPQTGLHVASGGPVPATFRVGNTPGQGLDYSEASGDLYVGGNANQDGDIFVIDRTGVRAVSLVGESKSISLGTRKVADSNGCYYA